jgi:hypothetical protein
MYFHYLSVVVLILRLFLSVRFPWTSHKANLTLQASTVTRLADRFLICSAVFGVDKMCPMFPSREGVKSSSGAYWDSLPRSSKSTAQRHPIILGIFRSSSSRNTLVDYSHHRAFGRSFMPRPPWSLEEVPNSIKPTSSNLTYMRSPAGSDFLIS